MRLTALDLDAPEQVVDGDVAGECGVVDIVRAERGGRESSAAEGADDVGVVRDVAEAGLRVEVEDRREEQPAEGQRRSSGPARVMAILRTLMKKTAGGRRRSRAETDGPERAREDGEDALPGVGEYSSWNWTVGASFLPTTVSAENAIVSPATSDGTRGVTLTDSAAGSANEFRSRVVLDCSTIFIDLLTMMSFTIFNE